MGFEQTNGFPATHPPWLAYDEGCLIDSAQIKWRKDNDPAAGWHDGFKVAGRVDETDDGVFVSLQLTLVVPVPRVVSVIYKYDTTNGDLTLVKEVEL